MAPDAAPSKSGAWRVWRQDLARAIVFLTRLPVRWPEAAAGEPDGLAALARALRCAPLVGVLVGAAGALALILTTGLHLPPLVSAGLALAVSFAITGGLHEDGLADVADGFGGGEDVARKLAIMRDSRVGSYGVAAIVFSLLLRVGALAALAAVPGGALALIGAHALGRAAMLPVMRGLKPARADGLGHGAGRPSRGVVATALLLGTGAILLTLGPLAGMVALGMSALATGLVARLAARQVHGYTGDVLGTVEQTVETVVLLTAASLLAATGPAFI
ncbi:adenosylcobinamide-GDP ribazoletransferase [Rhodovibrio salinarum]|uniref:Adenosylcobinamide-GDP ribazoletransferase n=1 Tax=Rhodovibrio salinarum TaxID=1087 RepID=A0A934V012_9PROT|nr:adenosylcobinamide-GDP ribazoletransferase [Rhodovibrio salinarum]MBK1696974.1 adenosylcobinamide-GDP ribazoletransferase [Rhodovibrio salinarum]